MCQNLAHILHLCACSIRHIESNQNWPDSWYGWHWNLSEPFILKSRHHCSDCAITEEKEPHRTSWVIKGELTKVVSCQSIHNSCDSNYLEFTNNLSLTTFVYVYSIWKATPLKSEAHFVIFLIIVILQDMLSQSVKYSFV